MYTYIHKKTYTNIYIYTYIHMADSPDQPQLKTQKCTNSACELNNNIPYQSKQHRGYMKKHTPHYAKKAYYVFLARFGVCLGGTLRGLWKGECSLPTKCISVSTQESIPKAYEPRLGTTPLSRPTASCSRSKGGQTQHARKG